MNDGPTPRDASWLGDHAERVLNFYHPDCVDEEYGGYVAQFDEETGEIYDRRSKHLVATCRFVVNYSVAERLTGLGRYDSAVEHGLRFLLDHQRDDRRGGFHWIVEGTDPVESKRVCYGHAFALLALSRAAEAGVGDAARVSELHDFVDERFWEPEPGLYASEYDADWSAPADYRGQNANMHTCEAMIAAHEATDENRYLDRALTIAESLTVSLTEATDGLIWEHYTAEWEHDFEYNRDDPTHTFRPWGYQPGHHIEWAKLLATLDRLADAEWLVGRAEELFDAAVRHGWDDDRGGFYYTFDPDGDPVVTDKYSWEVAEAIGAAAALYERTGDERYLDRYDEFWAYARDALVNAERGNWYTKVTEENEPAPMTEGVAVEPGYHPIGACLEATRSLARSRR